MTLPHTQFGSASYQEDALHQLVIIDADKDVREVLRLVTHQDGYHSTLFPTSDAALPYLRQRSRRAIVLFEHSPLTLHRSQSLLWSLLDEDATLRQQHAYVLMTTNVLTIPTHRIVQIVQMPLLYKPFSLDALLLALHQAAHHLEVSAL
jgi:DNA-binding NtrC family response regulator